VDAKNLVPGKILVSAENVGAVGKVGGPAEELH
jgi:hypothetical protein